MAFESNSHGQKSVTGTVEVWNELDLREGHFPYHNNFSLLGLHLEVILSPSALLKCIKCGCRAGKGPWGSVQCLLISFGSDSGNDGIYSLPPSGPSSHLCSFTLYSEIEDDLKTLARSTLVLEEAAFRSGKAMDRNHDRVQDHRSTILIVAQPVSSSRPTDRPTDRQTDRQTHTGI